MAISFSKATPETDDSVTESNSETCSLDETDEPLKRGRKDKK